MGAVRDLRAGDPAPTFIQRSSCNPRYVFDTAAGRHLLLCLLGTADDDHSRAAIAAVTQRSDLFNDSRACFFGVTMDPADEAGRVQESIPGWRYFWDADGMVSKIYGGLPKNAAPGPAMDQLERKWILIDPSFRIRAVLPFADDRSDIERILALTEELSEPQLIAESEVPAPVLVLPRVFEPEFCDELIAYCKQNELLDSGFMVERDGTTVIQQDASYKLRQDCLIEDEKLREKIRMRIVRTILPQITKAFQFGVSRIERYVVGCYTETNGGFFHPHRDNTTRGTAHRRFAVSIGLTDDYDGGELVFPEFGKRTYKPPRGGAVVFSCSLLHQVKPVHRGERFVLLPFLYDDAAAKVRDRNRKFVKLDT